MRSRAYIRIDTQTRTHVDSNLRDVCYTHARTYVCARRRRGGKTSRQRSVSPPRTERKRSTSTPGRAPRNANAGHLSRTDNAPHATMMGATVRKCRGVQRGAVRAVAAAALKTTGAQNAPPARHPAPPSTPPLDRIVRYPPPASLSPNFPPAFPHPFTPTARLPPRPLPAPSPSARRPPRGGVNRERHDATAGSALSGNARPLSEVEATTGDQLLPPPERALPRNPMPEDFIPRILSPAVARAPPKSQLRDCHLCVCASVC